ncbi:MAG TPA: response regulator transcription factor [Baekduia sp.]|nr:response regulator transcription factor [Baekduia sp.]
MTTIDLPDTMLASGAAPPDASNALAPLRVVIADDHPLFRRGLARALQRDPRFQLVGEAADGREALRLIELTAPDVAVLDLRMPGLSGIDVCEEVLSHAPELPPGLLLLSAFEDDEIVRAAIAAGADGYVGKEVPQAEVCDAIYVVALGGTYRPPPAGRRRTRTVHEALS